MNPNANQSGAFTSAKRPQRRFFLTLLELMAIGTLGWIVFAAAASFLGIGLGLLLIAGIGILFLLGLFYILYGTGAFEVMRVDGLYDLGAEPLPLARPEGPGFRAYLNSVGTQLSSGRMWAAIGSFALNLLLGSILVTVIKDGTKGLIRGISQASLVSNNPGDPGNLYWVNPDFLGNSWLTVNGPLWNFGVVLACIAIAVLVVYVSSSASVAIIGSSARSTQLSDQARKAQKEAQQNLYQREGAVRAADVERTRIERDLHDGVQPRLVSVGMTLGLAQQQIDTDPAKAKELIAEAHTSTKAAITELRQLARGIHASVLDDRGLDAALSALAGRSPVPVRLDVRLIDEQGIPIYRVSREAETAVYFAIAESLTNAAKHSKASECRVTVRLRPTVPVDPSNQRTGLLWVRVEDNGVGGARVISGGGIDGVINRIHAAGGTARLDSPPNGPTSLEASVPCAY